MSGCARLECGVLNAHFSAYRELDAQLALDEQEVQVQVVDRCECARAVVRDAEPWLVEAQRDFHGALDSVSRQHLGLVRLQVGANQRVVRRQRAIVHQKTYFRGSPPLTDAFEQEFVFVYLVEIELIVVKRRRYRRYLLRTPSQRQALGIQLEENSSVETDETVELLERLTSRRKFSRPTMRFRLLTFSL